MNPSSTNPRAPGPAGTNLEQAKWHNRRVIIETVRLHNRLTRAELARLTALTPQTVSNITAELQASGMLIAHDPLRAGRGQPATPLSLNPDGAYSIGIQIDHQSLTGMVVDMAGKVRARVVKHLRRPGPGAALPAVQDMVQQLFRQAKVDNQRMLGVGLVMPGPFGVEGISSAGPTTLPGWEQVDVAAEVGRLVGLPAQLENDANAAAIGERLYGVAKTLQNFAYLFVGTGLGAGLILEGRMFRGHAGNAGEAGHMIVVPGGRPCYCGNRGCLERYVSLDAAYETLGIVEADRQTPQTLLDLGDGIDPWLNTAVTPLRQTINVLETLLDLETIVIGGTMPAAILQRLVDRLEPLPASLRSPLHRAPRLLVGAVGEDTAVLGAAALPIFAEFNPQYDALQKSIES